MQPHAAAENAPTAGPSSPSLISGVLQTHPSFGISDETGPPVSTLPVVVITYPAPEGPPRSVKARIDSNVPIEEVVRQLCASPQLCVPGDPALWTLRDTAGLDLVTQDNVLRKVAQGNATFNLVSPKLEAADIVRKLEARDERSIKMALFSLKDHLKEATFADEFVARAGPHELISICRIAPVGNTLAYALAALEALTELPTGWEGLDPEAVSRIAHLVVHATPVNVLRPATAILRRLAVSGPSSRSIPAIHLSGVPTDATVFRYGFDAVWPAIVLEDDLLKTLAKRIAAGAKGDFGLAQASLGLVNALTRGSLASVSFEALQDHLEQVDMRGSVVRLLEHQRGGELLPSVLTFQTNVVASANRLLNTAVIAEEPSHVAALITMADHAKALDARYRSGLSGAAASTDRGEDEEKDLEARKWKTTGFESENLLQDFEGVGLLGLRMMQRFVHVHAQDFDKLMLEQLVKPENKRCPFAKASNECTEILAELYDWNTLEAASAPSTVCKPFMLLYPRAHSLALIFWYKIWNSSGATTTDFSRVGVLVRSQVKGALRNDKRPWGELAKEFDEASYARVRDRQMQELALEDELLSKAPVRNLRSRLYQESFDFVRKQRIQALHDGSWFAHTVNPSREGRRGGGIVSGPRGSRYYRLGPNRKYLHYVERSEKGVPPSSVEEMSERIDVASITDIVPAVHPSAGHLSPSLVRSRMSAVDGSHSGRTNSIRFSIAPSVDGSSSAGLGSSTVGTGLLHSRSYTFSLMSGDSLLAELTAPDADTYSEWLDGISLLRPEGYISTKETADLVHTLTQIGTQIKLLDLSGERIEIPSHLAVPPCPISTDFFYGDPGIAVA